MSESPASQRPEIPQADGVGQSTAVFNRYYHLFEEGELRELLSDAARELNIHEESRDSKRPGFRNYIEIVRDDWERSNYYVEFRLYQE